MRLYSHGNPTPFVNGYVREVVPVWDNAQGESDAIFTGLKLTLSDGVTVVFIDVDEADKIYQVMAYR